MPGIRQVVKGAAALGGAGVAGFYLGAQGTQVAKSHCQVPCGIYDDSGRITGMKEDVTTITKAINQVNGLSAKVGSGDATALNQATRWVTTKDAHAANIITTTAEYFLTQKVKEVALGDDGYQTYLETLAAHHRVLTAAMKTKQGVDPKAAQDLAHMVDDLGAIYSN